jgi:hypothetical protein
MKTAKNVSDSKMLFSCIGIEKCIYIIYNNTNSEQLQVLKVCILTLTKSYCCRQESHVVDDRRVNYISHAQIRGRCLSLDPLLLQ